MLSQARPGALLRPAWARSAERRDFQRKERGRGHALIGIDLGTTNSSVAVLGKEGPEVLVDDLGRKSVPSEVVVVNGKDTGVPSELIVNATHGYGEGSAVFYSFKRIMGLSFDEISEGVKSQLQYTIEPLSDHQSQVYYKRMNGCTITPVDLSACILRYMVNYSNKYYIQSIGETVDGAVVAVPAHFTTSQKQATIDAAEQAGISKVHLLQEPVAAALAYGIDGGTDGETILVFDWGGGTFDVSVLQAFEGIMEILGTDGDQFLGGDDIDQLLVKYVQEVNEVPDSFDLYRKCRVAKESLALNEQATIPCSKDGQSITLTRDDLEQVARPLFNDIATVLDRIGKDLFIEWNMDPYDAITTKELIAVSIQESMSEKADPWAPPPRKVSKVVMVGQITRLPMVFDYVRRVTGVEPCSSVDPGEAVALGAATQAGILKGTVGNVELMDGSYSIDLHDRTTGFSNWQP